MAINCLSALRLIRNIADHPDRVSKEPYLILALRVIFAVWNWFVVYWANSLAFKPGTTCVHPTVPHTMCILLLIIYCGY